MDDVSRGAGASAFREFERRQAKDAAELQAKRDRVRQKFGGGKLGALAAALTVDSTPKRSTQVWNQGAVGEAKVGQVLDSLASDDCVVLHDRRIPGSRANIDHLVVTRDGVWVIDTKRYIDKRPERYGRDGLKVGGRKRDTLVEGALKQISLVQNFVGQDIPVRGVLCFVDSDWPLFGGSFTVRKIRVCWPKRLPRELSSSAARNPPKIAVPTSLARQLAAEFPPA